MIKKSIDELVTVRKEPGSIDKLPYVEIGDINIDTKIYSYKEKKSIEGCKKAKKGDIIVSRVRPSRGAVSLIKEDSVEVSSAFTILVPKKEILSKYLFYSIAYNKHFFGTLEKLQKGSSYPSCREKDILDYKISLSPLESQEKIVNILEKAEQLNQLRQESNILADEYLKSVFLEMFGDPIKNPKKWKIYTMDELCNLIRDGEHKTPTYVDIGIPFVTATNLIGEQLDIVNTKKISKEEHLNFSKRAKPDMNDLLMSKDGTIGVTRVVNTHEEFSIFVSVILIKPKKELVNSQFLKYLLSTQGIQRKINERIKGIAIRHLHLIDLRSLKIPLPPIQLQQEFADFVEKTEAIKQSQQLSQQEISNLFNVLMQKAFKGELVC